MNSKWKNFRLIGIIIYFVIIAIVFARNATTEKDILEFARAHESPPNPYVAEIEAQNIKPPSWYSVYLPSTVPEFYEMGISTETDTYISCEFFRPIDFKQETSLGNSYPDLYFIQWNYKREPISWTESIVPPILKTGEFQTYGSQTYGSQTLHFEDDPEDQLKLKMNATMQTQTYNGREYYFYDKTQNDNLLLLWYDEQNTFALSVEPGTGNKSHIKISLDEMLAIADSVEKYD
ncbi:hypothetical protein DSECCO2_188290 [anaerobic digester metagenome]